MSRKLPIVGEDEAVDVATGVGHELRLRLRLGQLGEQRRRAGQGTGLDYMNIRGGSHEPASLSETGPWVQARSRRGRKVFKESLAVRPNRPTFSRLEGWNLGKKLPGRLPLSDRAFAFLVTPKLPLSGRSGKFVWCKR